MPGKGGYTDIVKTAIGGGVGLIVEQLPTTPETLALDMFLKKLYKDRFIRLDEAVERVKELLRGIEEDPEQRRRLLEVRRAFCEKREALSLLADLFELAAGDSQMEDAAIANYAVIKVLLAQCEPDWDRLGVEGKAEILAPLYMALYHLKRYQETRHLRHLRSAATLAVEALNALEDRLGSQVDSSGS